jgi:hypothetical protein
VRTQGLCSLVQLLMLNTSLPFCSVQSMGGCIAGSVLQHRPGAVSGVVRSGLLAGTQFLLLSSRMLAAGLVAIAA